MGATNIVTAKLRDDLGVPIGTLTVELPGKVEATASPPPLLDRTDDPERESSQEPLQLLEGKEYRYAVALDAPHPGPIALEPEELFSPDSADWRTGRLRPGLYTGTLTITVLQSGQPLGRTLFEVRSRKLDYMDQYRWMLTDIADNLAELIMERFAPTAQSFTTADEQDARTRYQQFAFLSSLFSGAQFEAAIGEILGRPHRAWVDECELRRPGQPIPMGAGVARELTRPGLRMLWPASGATPPLPSLPAQLPVIRTQESLDTPENRFVKFALQRFSDFVATVQEALRCEAPTSPVRRGLRDVGAVMDRLQELLAADLFDEVGTLTQFPAGSQVLQKRAGYRELFQAYIRFEAAATLTWEGGDDVWSAGQRNVATLYEYWTFLQLVEVVGRLCPHDFDRSQLFEQRADGLGVALHQGRARGVKGSLQRFGRKIRIQLYYNQRFDKGTGERSSWSHDLRPDASLLIRPEQAYGAEDEVWLHFDAKYRVETLANIFGDDAAPETVQRKDVSRDDLNKMHAYRDAIRRSAGAYVLYPGTEPKKLLQMYHELLPGLGAFALRPTKDGTETGADALYAFIDKVITHVATQTTQHERARYWVREATREQAAATMEPVRPAMPNLKRPPADTLVLLGYVRTPEQLAWIHRERRYNLRADRSRRGSVALDSQELAVEYALLYGAQNKVLELWQVVGAPELRTEEAMRKSGYPKPEGAYFCLPLVAATSGDWLRNLQFDDLRAMYYNITGENWGSPCTVSWLTLAQWPVRVR